MAACRPSKAKTHNCCEPFCWLPQQCGGKVTSNSSCRATSAVAIAMSNLPCKQPTQHPCLSLQQHQLLCQRPCRPGGPLPGLGGCQEGVACCGCQAGQLTEHISDILNTVLPETLRGLTCKQYKDSAKPLQRQSGGSATKQCKSSTAAVQGRHGAASK